MKRILQNWKINILDRINKIYMMKCFLCNIINNSNLLKN